MVWRYCVDCKSRDIGEGKLTVLGLGGSRERQIYVGVCASCYDSDWHRALYGGDDDKEFVDELVNEALDKLTRELGISDPDQA